MAKRGREVDARWEWTEPSVWTERMLDALEGGVKGGKWYSLIDKVYAEETLRAAWKRVKRNRGGAGVDRETIEAFGRRRTETDSTDMDPEAGKHGAEAPRHSDGNRPNRRNRITNDHRADL
jgi:hypothetical protein